jgi:hypothetical protein
MKIISMVSAKFSYPNDIFLMTMFSDYVVCLEYLC